MTRFRLFTILLVVVLAFAVADARAEITNTTPNFKEVHDLIRLHLVDATDTELNRAAVDGLISQFGGKVSIVDTQTSRAAPDASPITRITVLESVVGYIRVNQVRAGLADALSTAWRELNATNKLQGLVLDLRFAAGDDYSAAVAAAELFVSKERPLLDWGNGVVRSKPNADPISMPVAILVNAQTHAAAEALAAVLRESGAGLILGAKTAGTAMTAREFPLQNGQLLRIATSPVKLGDGSTLSAQGLQPDINVTVRPQAERQYFDDPYATSLGGTSTPVTNVLAGSNGETNQLARRPRLSEAELVRQRREGVTNQSDDPPAASPREPAAPIILDPPLARAVDLLKMLAVFRKANP